MVRTHFFMLILTEKENNFLDKKYLIQCLDKEQQKKFTKGVDHLSQVINFFTLSIHVILIDLFMFTLYL